VGDPASESSLDSSYTSSSHISRKVHRPHGRAEEGIVRNGDLTGAVGRALW